MPNAPDGTVIKMPDGSLRVKRGAQWLPTGSMYVGPGPKLEPQERKSLETARAAAEKAGGTLQDLDRFSTLNKQQKSGGPLGWPIVRDVVGAFDPEVGEMNAITNRLTPAQREAGSGAMSDRDVEMYRSSVVSYGQQGPANKAIGARSRAGAIRQKEHAEFLDYFARVNGTLNGAQEMWNAYKEAEPVYDHQKGSVRRYQPWRAYFGIGAQSSGQGQQRPAAGPAATPAPKASAAAKVKVGKHTYEVIPE